MIDFKKIHKIILVGTLLKAGLGGPRPVETWPVGPARHVSAAWRRGPARHTMVKGTE